MWKSIGLFCLILILAAWFYRPAHSRINLGPGNGAFIVTEKGEHLHGSWLRLTMRGVVGEDYDWGYVKVPREEWDLMRVGDGYGGGNIFRKGK